mgnify:FL=1
MVTASALLFTALMTIAVGFQIALALGAPWGERANGGRWHGTLPKPMRVAAVVQGCVLSSLIAVVLSHAGLINWAVPAWAIWSVVGIMALSSIMNIATPSAKERRLWAPIVTLSCISEAIVGFLV